MNIKDLKVGDVLVSKSGSEIRFLCQDPRPELEGSFLFEWIYDAGDINNIYIDSAYPPFFADFTLKSPEPEKEEDFGFKVTVKGNLGTYDSVEEWAKAEPGAIAIGLLKEKKDSKAQTIQGCKDCTKPSPEIVRWYEHCADCGEPRPKAETISAWRVWWFDSSGDGLKSRAGELYRHRECAYGEATRRKRGSDVRTYLEPVTLTLEEV